MKLICKSEIITANDVIQTSKIIAHMMEDCRNKDDPVPIPDEYYSALITPIESKDAVLIAVQFFNAIKDHSIDITDEKYNDFIRIGEEMKSKIITLISNRILLLMLYNFLHVDEKYINTLAKETGLILEQLDIIMEVPFDILTLIVNNFPSLYLDNRYQDVGISEDLQNDIVNNPRKYESVYYRGKYNSHIDNMEYIKADNPNVIEYCVTTLVKNNPTNGSEKICIDLTGLIGQIYFNNLSKKVGK